MPEEQNNQEEQQEQNNNQDQEQQVTQSPITSEDPVVTQSDLKRFYEAIKPYLNTVSIPGLDIGGDEEPVNAVITLLDNGNEITQEPALNFKDFDISDDSENERTDIKSHRLSLAELDEIVTAPPAVYRGNEYSESELVVGHWIDGKPIYQKSYHINREASSVNCIIDSTLNRTTTVPISTVGYLKISNGNWISAGYYGRCNFIIDENGFGVNTGDYSFSDVYVTIQYTKTTD